MRNLLRHKFLLLPLLVVGLIFLLDKIFLLPEVRDNFLQPGGMLYYHQRARQIETVKKYLEEREPSQELLLVFGDSRSFAIGDKVAKYLGYPNLDVFNFAGPQGLPAYYLYLVEKLLNGEKRPEYLVIGVSPDSFNRNSGTFVSPVLNYGVDELFIKKYRELIPDPIYEAHLKNRRFALGGIRFSSRDLFKRLLGTLSGSKKGEIPENLKMLLQQKGGESSISPEMQATMELAQGAINPTFSHYSLEKSPQVYILDGGRGAQYKWFGFADDETLKRDTERLKRFYLKSYQLATEQLKFMELTLKRAQLAGVKTVVFWPRVNPYLRELYRSEPQIREIWEKIEQMAARTGALTFDMNDTPGIDCNTFYDASHISINCSPQLSSFLFKSLKIKK